MTDWTTPEDVPTTTVERLHRWLLQEGNPEDAATPGERAVADIIRTFWPVPATTLSEELANITEHWKEWTTKTITAALNAATDFAKQTEYELAEARAEIEQAEDRAAEWQGIAQRDYARVELLGADLAETRAEVERLTAVAEDYGRRATAALTERDEARAEVERLTAVSERLRRTDNYRQFREKFLTVQKGAESDAESLDPADVKPGEAWLVECRGERRAAVKDRDDDEPWNTFTAGGLFFPEENENITLVSRLVPAPRVITNPDELDTLAEQTIVRDHYDGEALQKINGKWIAARIQQDDGFSSGNIATATVLWEPEA